MLRFTVLWIVAMVANAQDSRLVLNGDVVYVASSSADSEREALFRAEGQAVRMLAVECSVPPREARVFSQAVVRSGAEYRATVQLGVALADCEAARRATLAEKKRAVNPALGELYAAYAKFLVEPISRLSALPAHSVPAFHFSNDELAAADRALEARVREREKLRQQLRKM